MLQSLYFSSEVPLVCQFVVYDTEIKKIKFCHPPLPYFFASCNRQHRIFSKPNSCIFGSRAETAVV